MSKGKQEKRSKKTATVSGARRIGDEYQDLVALEVILHMLRDPTHYEWIRLESSDAKYLDDIVAKRMDGALVAMQVKASVHPDDPKDPWTWEDLFDKVPPAKESLLGKWITSLLVLKENHPQVEASVRTNRHLSIEIEKCLDSQKRLDYSLLPIEVQTKMSELALNEENAKEFCRVFRFDASSLDIEALETDLRRSFEVDLNGEPSNYELLRAEIRAWIRNRNLPREGGYILLEDARKAARWTVLKGLSEEFELPEILSPLDYEVLDLDSATASEGAIRVLTGAPGVGKSTFLTSYFDRLKSDGKAVIKHYYFLPNDADTFFDRFLAKRAMESLMVQLQNNYPDAVRNLQQRNPTPDQFSRWIRSASSFFHSKGESLAVIIDGLDHLYRDQHSLLQFKEVLDALLPVGQGLVLILGTQRIPIKDLSYFETVCPDNDWKELSPLSLGQVEAWLERILPNVSNRYEQETHNNAVVALHKRSKGYPLIIHLTLKALESKGRPFNERSIRLLPEIEDNDLRQYYRSLLTPVSQEAKSILILLASVSFPLSKPSILAALGLGVSGPKFLKEIEFLLRYDSFGCRLYHQSLQVFLRELEDYEELRDLILPNLISWMKDEGPQYLRWTALPALLCQYKDKTVLDRIAGLDWMWTAARFRYNIDAIRTQYVAAHAYALQTSRLDLLVPIIHFEQSLRDVHDYYEDTYAKLLELQLHLDLEEYVRKHALLELEYLSREELVQTMSYAFASADDGLLDQASETFITKRFILGNPSKDHSSTYISEVKVLLRGLSYFKSAWQEIFIHVIEDHGASYGGSALVEMFCEELENRGRVAELQILYEHAQLEDFRSIVAEFVAKAALRQAVALVSRIISEQASPLITICSYRHNILREPDKYHGSKPEVLTLSKLPILEQHRRKIDITKLFVSEFTKAFANALNGRGTTGYHQIANLSYYDKLLICMDEIGCNAAIAAQSGIPIPYELPFQLLEKLPQPTMSYRDESESGYALAAKLAAIEIAEMTHAFNLGRDKPDQIAIHKLEAYSYFNLWLWSERLSVDDTRSFLHSESDCCDQLLFRAKILLEPSAELIDKFIQCAKLAIRSGKRNIAGEALAHASKLLVSYGPHKDLTMFMIFELMKAWSECDPSKLRRWIAAIRRPLLYIDQYTDGDETSFAITSIGELLLKHMPEEFPSYYMEVLSKGDYHDAEELLSQLAEHGDLSDAGVQSLILTAPHDRVLRTLERRFKREGTTNLQESILNAHGRNIFSKIKQGEDDDNKTGWQNTTELDQSILAMEPMALEAHLASNGQVIDGRVLELWATKWVQKQATNTSEVLLRVLKNSNQPKLIVRVYESLRASTSLVKLYPLLVRGAKDSSIWATYATSREASDWYSRIIIKDFPQKVVSFVYDTGGGNKDVYTGQHGVSLGSLPRVTRHLVNGNEVALAVSLTDAAVKVLVDITAVFPLPNGN